MTTCCLIPGNHFELGIKNCGAVEEEGTLDDDLVQLPCSKQSQLEQVTQDHVQLSFEHLQGQRTSTPLTKLLQCLITITIFYFFSLCLNRFFCFPLCAYCLLPIHSASLSLVPSSFCTPLQYLYTLLRSPLSLLFSSLNNLSSLSRSS